MASLNTPLNPKPPTNYTPANKNSSDAPASNTNKFGAKTPTNYTPADKSSSSVSDTGANRVKPTPSGGVSSSGSRSSSSRGSSQTVFGTPSTPSGPSSPIENNTSRLGSDGINPMNGQVTNSVGIQSNLGTYNIASSVPSYTQNVNDALRVRSFKGDPTVDSAVRQNVDRAIVEQLVAKQANRLAGSRGSSQKEYEKLFSNLLTPDVYATNEGRASQNYLSELFTQAQNGNVAQQNIVDTAVSRNILGAKIPTNTSFMQNVLNTPFKPDQQINRFNFSVASFGPASGFRRNAFQQFIPSAVTSEGYLKPTTLTMVAQSQNINPNEIDYSSPQTIQAIKDIDAYNKQVGLYNEKVAAQAQSEFVSENDRLSRVDDLSNFASSIITNVKKQQTSPGTYSFELERGLQFDPEKYKKELSGLSPEKQTQKINELQQTLELKAGDLGVPGYRQIDLNKVKGMENLNTFYDKFIKPVTNTVSDINFYPINKGVEAFSPSAAESLKSFERGLVGGIPKGIIYSGALIPQGVEGGVNVIRRTISPIRAVNEDISALGGLTGQGSILTRQSNILGSKEKEIVMSATSSPEALGETVVNTALLGFGARSLVRDVANAAYDVTKLKPRGTFREVIGEDIVRNVPSGSKNIGVIETLPSGVQKTTLAFEPTATTRGIGFATDTFENALGTRVARVTTQGLQGELRNTRLGGSYTGNPSTVGISGTGVSVIKSTQPEVIFTRPSNALEIRNLLRNNVAETNARISDLAAKQYFQQQTGIPLRSIPSSLTANSYQPVSSIFSGPLTDLSSSRIFPEITLRQKGNVITGEGYVDSVTRELNAQGKLLPKTRRRNFATEQEIIRGNPIVLESPYLRTEIGTPQSPSKVLADTTVGGKNTASTSVIDRVLSNVNPESGVRTSQVNLRTTRTTTIDKVPESTQRFNVEVEAKNNPYVSPFTNEAFLNNAERRIILRDVRLKSESLGELSPKPLRDLSPTTFEKRPTSITPTSSKSVTEKSTNGDFRNFIQMMNEKNAIQTAARNSNFIDVSTNRGSTVSLLEKPSTKSLQFEQKRFLETDLSNALSKNVLDNTFAKARVKPLESSLKSRSGVLSNILRTSGTTRALTDTRTILDTDLKLSPVQKSLLSTQTLKTESIGKLETKTLPVLDFEFTKIDPVSSSITVSSVVSPSIINPRTLPLLGGSGVIGGGGPTFNFGSLPSATNRRLRERTITNKLKDITLSTFSGKGLKNAIGVL